MRAGMLLRVHCSGFQELTSVGLSGLALAVTGNCRSVLHSLRGLSTLILEYLGYRELPGKERPRSPSPTLLSGVALRSGSSGFRVVLPHQDESAATS